MRRLLALGVVLLSVAPLSAQLHHATPLNVLLGRLGVSHEHDGMSMPMDMALAAPVAAVMTSPVSSATSKTFNVTAHQFQFDFSPAPFVVNAGDEVTLNITVPSNDGSSVGHGFFLESYMTDAVPIARGKTVTVHFIATTAGTFTYLCTVTCGAGHPTMHGTLTVNAAPAGPAISSIAPSTGPVTGGTQITISGSGFAQGATVTIGGIAATSVNVVDASTITALTPEIGPTEESGLPKDVVVTNPDGTSATLAAAFSYTLPPLSISGVEPNGAPPSGASTITITGSGFTTAVNTIVTFGGIAATDVRVISSTVMTVTAPPHAPGTVDVVVTVGSSSVTLAGGFTYANGTARRRTVRK